MTSAIYFDGLSARLHRVELETAAGSVVVAGPGIARVYTAGQVRMAEPFDRASMVVYFSDGARCEMGAEMRAELAHALGYRAPRVVRLQAHWAAAMAALVLLLALIGATALWGLPAAAEMLAQRLPPAVDASLGQSMLASLEKRQVLLPTRFSDERLAEINRVMAKVMPDHPRVPIRLLVRDSSQLGANALALPGGTIVLTDQMVRFILGKQGVFGDEAVAQLAGVLAHEIGHIQQRHSSRVLTRTSLTAALSATLFGDFSAVAAGVPAVLMNMSYSREMETEADMYAIKTLQEKDMPLKPLAGLFEALDEMPGAMQAREMPRWLAKTFDYAASHPATSERIDRLRKADEKR
jgi:predicted Zn-dependent protease